MTKYAIIAAAVALLFHSASAWAQDPATPNLTFNGFGTVGMTQSDEEEADFVSDLFAPDGVGHSRDWSPEVDSRLGLQLTADLTSRLTAVGQVVIEQRYDENYDPTVEWANLKYDVTPEFSVRVGRKVLPVFMNSGHRKVGYANPWVRPPPEVYQLVPVTNSDGIDFIHRTRFDGFTNTLQGSYGQKDAKVSGGSEIESRDGMTVANTLEWDATTLFVSYNRSNLTWDSINEFFDAFRAFGPAGEAIADRYDLDDTRSEVLTIGARHDPGDWFLMGEAARTESRSFLADSRAWYVTGGYRHGSVTPYLTLARRRVSSNTSDPGVNAPPAEPLNEILNQILRGAAAEQSRIAVGTRWDFAPGAALKVQIDYLDLEDESNGTLTNIQPGFNPGGSVTVFSATVDFVF